MNAKQNELTAELLKLIQENPELPVVPMVAGEVVPNDEYGYWLGRWGKAKVDEYLPSDDAEGEIFFKSEDDAYSVLESRLGVEDFGALLDLEDENELRTRYLALPWKKAIVVRIECP